MTPDRSGLARRRWPIVVGVLIAAVVGLFLVSVVAGDIDAAAQDDACDDVLNFGADFEVSTGEELIAAFTCANQSSSIEIVLLNDIVVETVSAESVLPQLTGCPIGAGEVFIDGGSHSISRGLLAGDAPLPLISVGADGCMDLIVLETQLVLGPADTAAVRSLGALLDLRLWASSITASAGSTATAIDLPNNDELVTITESTIVGAQVGIHVGSPAVLALVNTTVASTDTDIRKSDRGFVEVLNSTLAAPIGIEAAGGVAFVTSSTISGDGFVAPVGSNSQVVFRSSIVGSCSTPLLPDHDDVTFPTPFHVDYGGNVGGCFGIDTPVEPLADNECFWDPSSLCTPTAALPSDSPALGAGDCSASDVGGSQEVVTLDQRGSERSPAGPGCDAGAFEATNAVGDVEADGDVDNADVMALLAWLAGGDAPAGADAADVNNDGEVRLDDALLLARIVAEG